MSKDLPFIFKNTSNKKIENNKKVFYSKYENISNIESNNNEINLEGNTYQEALNNLFKNNQFVFNVPVEIITKDKNINTKIVSKVNDHLLTSNGEVIKLEDILSIVINND